MKKITAVLLLIISLIILTSCKESAEKIELPAVNIPATIVPSAISVAPNTIPVITLQPNTTTDTASIPSVNVPILSTLPTTTPQPSSGGGDNELISAFIRCVRYSHQGIFENYLGIKYERLNNFGHNEIEPHKWERQTEPMLYKYLQYFEISKEQFVEGYKQYVQNYYDPAGYPQALLIEDWVIDALYAEDEREMRKALVSPYALYSEAADEVYTLLDICGIDREHEYEGMPEDLEAMISAETLYHELGFSSDDLQGLFDRISADYPGEWRYYVEQYPPLLLRLEEIRALEKADATSAPPDSSSSIVTAPTPPPAADTVLSVPGGDVPSVPDPVTPPNNVPIAANP